MLPFEAESIDTLRARYPKALERVWRLDEIEKDRPGLHRENVFDFPSGIRLLISKDMFYEEDGERIHISASREYDNTPIHIDELTRLVKSHWYQIGGNGILQFIGLSGKGIPHWLVHKES